MPEGARMKKAALITAIVLLFAVQSLSAVTSRFVLASSVVNRSQTNPAVILNIQATDVSAYVDTGIETSAITDLNLTEDGSITFALMTSAEVFISAETFPKTEGHPNMIMSLLRSFSGVTTGRLTMSS